MDTISQLELALIKVDENWLLNIQRKLFHCTRENPEPYRELWNWVTDSRNLRLAFRRVATNQGRNTPGVDGMTVKRIHEGTGKTLFLERLQLKLRSGEFKPLPVRRRWIPKPDKPKERRALGIPTVEDRVVQAAILQIIEPLFEARFYHVSYGFRPGRSVRDAIENIRITAWSPKRDKEKGRTQIPYTMVIEGDIRKCFDEIDHHALMKRVRLGVSDRKVTRLITAFLKSGVMEELNYLQTTTGTPQGGILSPLLSNIALSVIEERYQEWLISKNTKIQFANRLKVGSSRREYDRKHNRPIFYPIRYADDFIILFSGPKEKIYEEKEKLAAFLKEKLGLTLSEEKTRITTFEEGFTFLGHHIRTVRKRKGGHMLLATIPMDRQKRLLRKVKNWTRRCTINRTLEQLLRKLNPILRGWANFYRHASAAGTVFSKIDHLVYWRIFRWLKQKHPRVGLRVLWNQFIRRPPPRHWMRWSHNDVHCFLQGEVKRERWDLHKRKLPQYMFITGKPGT